MNIIEFFFCPVHGLLRPANWGLVGWMLSDAGLLVQMWMSRIMGWMRWEAPAKQADAGFIRQSREQ